MKRCILHIGWHKTGTTALQDYLHAHAPSLRTHGVFYPTFDRNHSAFLPSAVLADAEPSYAEWFVPPFKGYEASDKREAGALITSRILREFAESDATTIVLSAEDLCLLDPAGIDRCHRLLSADIDEIRVVAYLREHGGYAHSAVQQLVRMGFEAHEVVDMAELGRPPMFVLEPLPHYARLADWVRTFGRDAISLHSYDEVVRNGDSIQRHFLHEILRVDDSELTSHALHHPRINTSFTDRAAYVVNVSNRLQPLLIAGRPNPGFEFNRQQHVAALSGAAFVAPAEILDPLQAGRVGDVEVIESLVGRRIPLPEPRPERFATPVHQLFAGDPVLDDVAAAIAALSSRAAVAASREKFFAAMVRLHDERHRALAVRQLHVALFLMADQAHLVSSANWLLGAGEPDLARVFLAKAERFPDRPAALVHLAEQLDAATLRVDTVS